jgi:hypothetical protein
MTRHPWGNLEQNHCDRQVRHYHCPSAIWPIGWQTAAFAMLAAHQWKVMFPKDRKTRYRGLRLGMLCRRRSAGDFIRADRCRAFVLVRSPKTGLQQLLQRLCGAVVSAPQGCAVMAHSHGLAPGASCLHAAPLVVVAGFRAIFVAQMDLHSRDSIAEPVECSADVRLNMARQYFMPFNIMVSVDLDLHRVPLLR